QPLITPVPQRFWRFLESLPGLAALPAVWMANLGAEFPGFKSLCLQDSTRFPTHIPCPVGCGCDPLIIFRHDRTGAIGACRCSPSDCPDVPLEIANITPLEVDWERLAHGICQAFGCESNTTKLKADNTIQIGSWSAEAVPVILT